MVHILMVDGRTLLLTQKHQIGVPGTAYRWVGPGVRVLSQ
jgi:hypothetical protein